MTLDSEVIDRFAYHPASERSAVLHNEMRTRATELALWANSSLPVSREASLALTAIQEAMMWGNAAIAIHGAPAATEEQRTTIQPSHGQEAPACGNCSGPVRFLASRSEHGSLNPHWGASGWTCGGSS